MASMQVFQSQWPITDNDLFNEINKIMTGGSIVGFIDSTLSSLIPKVPNPKRIVDFRPTSFCSMVYKVVTKTIANWIMYVLPYIIS